ncbi:Uncharacterised protein [Bordetella pertussis]|nr:Uncharacterised protein [Bordetella pertussis]
MRHLDETVGKRTVLRRPLGLARRRQRGNRRSVIVPLAKQDLVFPAGMVARGDLAHHLEYLLVGLGARVRKIHPAHARHLRDQLPGEQRAGHIARALREIVQLEHLVAHGVGDPLPPVADIDGPESAGRGVQVLLAAGIADTRALSFDHHPGGRGLQGVVLQHVMPDGIAVVFDDAVKIIDRCQVVHGNLPLKVGAGK